MKTKPQIEVLLRSDVDNLGHMGDVVNVSAGYARNYLMPRRLAVPVTPANQKEIEAAREARRLREMDEITRVTHQADLLKGFICLVEVKATEKGHLFGSVGPQQVAEQLTASGFEGIRPSNINLEKHIEELGDYEVEVMLHPTVRTQILVRVVAEGG